MRKLFLTLAGFAFSFSVISQTKKPKNNHVFLEGLGSLGYYSINLDKTLYKGNNFRDYVRVGFNVVQDSWTVALWPGKPLSYYMQYTAAVMIGTEHGAKKWKKEVSLGVGAVFGEPVRQYNIVAKYGPEYVDYALLSSFALRYNVEKIPIFLRIAYTPFYAFRQKQFLPFWIGQSIGYSF